MANPICLSPLKFYDALAKQERYKSYAYGNVSPVVMPLNVIYPFQFVADKDINSISSAYICEANANTEISDIIASLTESGLSIKEIGDYNVILLPNLCVLNGNKQGQYFLKLITDTNVEYYSEVFCFTGNVDDYIEIEYWNPESDFWLKNGVITFDGNFRFRMLIGSELGKPEYSYEEQATNRLGYNYIESQVSKKIYKFNAVLPEYLCDALRIVRLCSNKKLTSKEETYDMLSFGMDVDWQEQGDLASVTCEFEIDNIIVNTGGFKFAGVGGGDFNEDFNNDFNNISDGELE